MFRSILFVGFACCATAGVAVGQGFSPLTGGDHADADWTLSSGETVAGVHTKVKAFTIPAGVTASIGGTGVLEVYCTSVSIDGTLSGTGKGGLGGVAGTLDGAPLVRGGSSGTLLTTVDWGGGGGGAGGGGNGGNGAVAPGAGGTAQGVASDQVARTGGGGGAAYEVTQISPEAFGGDGGAAVKIQSLGDIIISVTGSIVMDGMNGLPDTSNGFGGGGGGGGGTIILISCGGAVNNGGTLSANGGNGASATSTFRDGGGGGGGGGAIKIFASGTITTGSTSNLAGSGGNSGGGAPRATNGAAGYYASAAISTCGETDCKNLVDDDEDGFMDCLDTVECSADPLCATAATTVKKKSSRDNDWPWGWSVCSASGGAGAQARPALFAAFLAVAIAAFVRRTQSR